MSPVGTHPTPPFASLAAKCDEHLQREIECLDRVNTALSRIREALVAVSSQELSTALDEQHEAAIAMAHVQLDRKSLRQEIARELSTNIDDATIGRFSSTLDAPWRERLDNARAKLRDLVLHSRRLAEGNALLTSHWSRIIDRMVEQLTGQPIPIERYSARGHKEGPGPSSVFQARY
jgi:hypothetical protein